MTRRYLSAAALVACAGVFAFAASERAIVILANGERQSGIVASHGGRYDNLNNGSLTLETDRGELTFRLEEIAVIDFTDREPTPAELDRLGADQMIVMRNGAMEPGRLVNVIGDTVVWDTGRGRPQQIPISSISRVYVNPDRARWAFNDREGRSNGAQDRGGRDYAGRDRGGRDDQSPYGRGRDYAGRDSAGRDNVGRDNSRRAQGAGTSGQMSGIQVRVDATQAWTDTGITVNAGDRVAFNASGQISFGKSSGQTSGPDGNPSEHRATYPDPTVPVGALIGKVGNSAPFGIGKQTQPLGMPASGRLMLGINDNERSDNSGFYTVTVTRQ